MNLTLYFKGGFGPCSKKTGLEKREQQHDKKTTMRTPYHGEAWRACRQGKRNECMSIHVPRWMDVKKKVNANHWWLLITWLVQPYTWNLMK